MITDEDGTIERFLEKPTWGQVFSDTINTGIYVLEPEIFDYIPEGRPVDFSGESFPAALADGKRLFGYVADGYWEDVGTLEAYLKAHQDILDRRVQVDIDGFPLRPGVWVGKGAEIDPSVELVGPGGDRRQLRGGARGQPRRPTAPSDATSASATTPWSSARWSTTTPTSARGSGSRAACSAAGSDLRQGVRCEEGVVLGDECFVGAHAEISAGVKVYPFKTVEAGAIVNSSIVWESRGARSLFGRDGVRGLANVDISPELAVRLSMAWASTLEKGATVTTSRDTSRAARVLKRAIMVGCNAAGVNVDDLEAATVPVTRFQVTSSGQLGGRHRAPGPRRPRSRWCSASSTRTASTSTSRPSGRSSASTTARTSAGCWPGRSATSGSRPGPSSTTPPALIDSVDLSAARTTGLKLVLDYSFGTASFVMPNLLAKLEAEVLVVNPYANTAGAITFDRQASAARVAELVRASGAQPGGGASTPGASSSTSSTTRATRSSTTRRCWCCSPWSPRSHPGARVALPVAVSRAAEEICRDDRHRDRLDQAVRLPPDGGGPLREGHPGGQPVGRLHLPVLPARLRRGGHPGQPASPC